MIIVTGFELFNQHFNDHYDYQYIIMKSISNDINGDYMVIMVRTTNDSGGDIHGGGENDGDGI